MRIKKTWVSLFLRLLVAAIFLQTLFFKFTAAPESVALFESLDAEPWGRIASGVAELFVSVCLFVPGFTAVAGLGGLVIMSGALVSHVWVLGIEVQGDGGLLFGMACVVFVSCAALVVMDRHQLKRWLDRFRS